MVEGVSNSKPNSIKEVRYDGKTYAANSGSGYLYFTYGKKTIKVNLKNPLLSFNGNTVEVKGNDPFKLKAGNKDKLSEDLGEQKQKHRTLKDRYKKLQKQAGEMFDNGLEALKKARKAMCSILRGRKYSELTGEDKERADVVLASMADNRKAKNKGLAQTLFYGHQAANEARYEGDYANMLTFLA